MFYVKLTKRMRPSLELEWLVSVHGGAEGEELVGVGGVEGGRLQHGLGQLLLGALRAQGRTVSVGRPAAVLRRLWVHGTCRTD